MSDSPSRIVRSWEAEAKVLWESGVSATSLGKRYGVSKDVICGLARRYWQRGDPVTPHRTLDWRCDALHARMDAVLAETADAIGRRYIPSERLR